MLLLLLQTIAFLAGVQCLPVPADGPLNGQGIPINLPLNETALYPPYTWDLEQLFFPNTQSIPIKIENTSKQPWNIQPNNDAQPFGIESACSALSASYPSSSDYWYEKIEHNGGSPFINDDNWQVYRNVVDYGADPSGGGDSQGAIQNALNDGSNSGFSRASHSLGSTGQPAVVYLPSGTYTINSPLQLYLGTVITGNPIDPPVIKAGSNFQGDTLIYGKDPNQGSTTNFYIGVKYLTLDSTAIDPGTAFTLLDWSVSQATQLSQVTFNMPDYSSGHTGITMAYDGGGSGTFMGDLNFFGGNIGIRMSNQQYEVKSANFNGCTTGIKVDHCFDCVFAGCTFMNGASGIDMSGGSIGSVVLLDSGASNVGTVIMTSSSSSGDHSLVIENFSKGSGVSSVVSASGDTVLNDNVKGSAWVYGNAYTPGGPDTGSHQTGTFYNTPRSGSLVASGGAYQAIPPPSYQQYDVGQFINVKSVNGYPVYGDGNTDDTNNLNAIISMYAGCKILFFPQGTYVVTNTLFFPTGSRVVGEAWSVISATGSNFYNPTAPTTMVKVGNSGDKGVAQFTDMLFTVADVLQGCTMLEVNMAGNSPGDVGFWNTHFRVGGALGSKVRSNCGGSPAECKAAFMMIHLTSSSSAYIENMWGWTADHDLDASRSGGGSQTISTGRGMLVEATSGTWLHGTAFEHNTLYQYNFQGASNVFVGMQQSEAPYWQGPGSSSLAPAPWTALTDNYHDPDFSNCDGGDGKCRIAWYTRISGGSNLFLYGSGDWTFFNNNNGDCQNDYCQTNAIEVDSGTTGLYWYGINTHAVLNMVMNNGATLVTRNNNPGSWGGVVAAFLSDSS
ncbi:glycoside hydrolase family 55 protein [Polychaeton citri CBS 116435]|uniref:Glycoside hydrolase family 55 protein n=1 Tax=Polychaeton citri CBS 116435 TaxID=1314669 RepID=A0A9P4UI38_9PEZI|nr:glycoside hydrolase family 55 protein [Polychaeton citri CBS 116435]